LIVKTIDQILQAQKGDILMTDELSVASEQLHRGIVPDLWKRISYPSLKPLASYISDLNLRMQMFHKWISNKKSPEVFWLSGFFFTQSFLTAILQNFARKYSIEIDQLEFEFRYTNETDPTNHEKEVFDFESAKKAGFSLFEPKDGALISGLYFEGANWDQKHRCMGEQEPK
jgi:dynein heavy chain, axonemal